MNTFLKAVPAVDHRENGYNQPILKNTRLYRDFLTFFKKRVPWAFPWPIVPGIDLKYHPFSGAAAGLLFCRFKDSGKQSVREKTHFKPYFSWAWTLLPVELETGIGNKGIGG